MKIFNVWERVNFPNMLYKELKNENDLVFENLIQGGNIKWQKFMVL